MVKQKQMKDHPRRPPAPRRLWLFRLLAAIVMPTALLLLAELALRLAGYGVATSAIIECRVDGSKAYCDNSAFGWQFFPKHVSRSTSRFVFPAQKSDRAYRVFILGASAAQGIPAPEYSFGRMLEVMLRLTYPGADFQVITTAMTAVNSHAALMIAQDCARHRPDLFIVYLGNNEVVGPYGAASVFAPLRKNLQMIRLGIALKGTRLGQLLRSIAEVLAGPERTPRPWMGLQMFLDKQVPADAPELAVVRRHFQQNLQDIAAIAQDAQAPIIFCSLGSNLRDSPPFASQHRPDLSEPARANWDQLYARAIAAETAGDYDLAVTSYLQTAKIDDTFADLHFRLGRCYWNLQQFDQAYDRYIQARQLDTLRFRPDSQINQIIRTVAAHQQAQGIYFFDADQLFRSHSPHGILGSELFLEHVHLNFTGNYVLAAELFQQIDKLLPERIRRRKIASASPPTRQQCAQSLAYTNWDRARLAYLVVNGFLTNPPFTNQLYHQERMTRWEKKLKSLGPYLRGPSLALDQKQYVRALRQAPRDWWLHWKYAQLLADGLRLPQKAVDHYRIVTELTPASYEAHANYGLALERVGKFDPALASARKALNLNPYSSQAHHLMGRAYVGKGQPEKAIDFFLKEIQLRPDTAEGYNQLGVVYARQGQKRKAEQILRRGLELSPAYTSLHLNLALVLEEQGRLDEACSQRAAMHTQVRQPAKAEQILRQGLRASPNSPLLRFNLASTLAQQKRYAEAMTQLRPLMQSHPNFEGLPQLLETLRQAGAPAPTP